MSQARMTPMIKISSLFAFFVFIYAGLGNVVQGQNTVSVYLGNSKDLSCYLEGKNLQNFTWSRPVGVDGNERLNGFEKVHQNTDSNHTTMTIKLVNVIREDNGTYQCQAIEDGHPIKNESYLKVIGEPEVEEFFAKAVMVDKLYVSWKVYNGNDRVSTYDFFHRLNDTQTVSFFNDSKKGEDPDYYVLNLQNTLKKDLAYDIGITATNSRGTSDPVFYAQDLVTPLEKDFIPIPSVISGATNDSITLTWMPPAADLQDYYNYTVMWNGGSNSTGTKNIVKNNTLTIESLEHETNYRFKVRACVINHPDMCGDWSSEVERWNSTTNSSPRTSSSSHALELSLVAITITSLCSLMN